MLTLYANFKGGTGKSTVVFNMAMWRQEQGQDVTVCDLDPQKTVTDVSLIRAEEGYTPSLKVVNKLPAKTKGDWLVDVGVSDMDAVNAAIHACDQIVIPVTPSQADIWATQRFLDIIKKARGRRKSPKIYAFINRADPHPRSRENAETMEALNHLAGLTVLDEKLVQRLAFRRSFSEGLAVSELEPNSKAAQELEALAALIYAE